MATHRYNQLLPPTYANELPAEFARNIHDIVNGLEAAARSDPPQLRDAAKWFGKLSAVLTLKYQLSDEEWQRIVHVAVLLAINPTASVSQRTSWLRSARNLLVKKRAHVKLNLPWRPFYDLLHKYVISTDSLIAGARSVLQAHQDSLVNFALAANRHWQAGAAEQILAQFQSDIKFTPSSRSLDAICVFRILFPANAQLPPSFSDLLRTWTQIDHCEEWELAWFRLLAQASKHSYGSLDWNSLLDLIFSKVLEYLRLPVANVKPASNPARVASQCLLLGTSQRTIAKLVARLLGRAELVDAVMQRLSRLISTVSTFFYPSNASSPMLAVFVHQLCSGVASIVGKQSASDSVSLRMSHENVRAFVGILLPVVQQGLYAPSHMFQSSCQMAIKHMASLSSSQVAAAIIPQLVDALNPSSVHETHQAPASLSTLAVLFQPLMYPTPFLAPHLTTLLEWALPGIDANDPFKTTATCSFLTSVVMHIPLIDATETESPDDGAVIDSKSADDGIDSDARQELYRAAWLATAGLCDWALLAVDRVLTYLSLRDAPSKSDMTAQLESFASAGLRNFTRSLFVQMSPQLFKVASGKVVRWVLDQSPLPGVKEIAALLATVVGVDPTLVLPQVLEPIRSRIVDGARGDTLKWLVGLFAGIVRRAGPALVPYKAALQAALAVGLAAEEVETRKVAGKLLRHSLKTLLMTYVTEYRSHTLSEIHAGKLWASWCAPRSWDAAAVQPSWHTPSGPEVELAVALLTEYLVAPVQMLEGRMQAGSNDRQTWRRCLATIRACIRGCTTMLHDHSAEADASVTNTGQVHAAVLLAAAGQIPSRAVLEDFIDRALRFLYQEPDSDIDSLKLACKISRLLLAYRGASSHKTFGRKQFLTFTKRQMSLMTLKRADHVEGGHKHASDRGLPRAMKLHRVQLLHDARLVSSAIDIAHAMRHDDDADMDLDLDWKHADSSESKVEGGVALVVRSLCTLCRVSQHVYSAVRKPAQTAAHSALHCYRWLARPLGRALLLRLTSRPWTHAEFTGTSYLLGQPTMLRRLAGDWESFDAFVSFVLAAPAKIAELPADRQQNAGIRAHNCFGEFVRHWQQIPVKATHNERARLRHAEHCVREVLTQLDPATSHWRNLLSGAAVLTMCVRPDLPISDDTWTWFLNTAVSEVVPLRTIAIRGLRAMLAVNMHWQSQLPLPVQERLLSDDYAAALVQACVMDHSIVHHSADGNAGARGDWSAGIVPILDSVAPFQYATPQARFQAPSGMVAAHLEMFRHLSASMMVPFVTAITTHLTLALSTANAADRRAHVLAISEAAAGILAGTPEANVADCAPLAIGLLRTTIPASGLEALVDLCSGLRFGLCQASPAFISAVLDYVVQEATSVLRAALGSEDAVTDTSVLAQTRWLCLLRSVLLEVAARRDQVEVARAAARRVLHPLLDALAIPSRAEVANALSIVLLVLSPIPALNEPSDLTAEWLPLIKAALGRLQADPAHLDAPPASPAFNLRYALVCLLKHAADGLDSMYNAPIVEALLPVLLPALAITSNELGTLATQTLGSLASQFQLSALDTTALAAMATTLISALKSPSWHHRLAALRLTEHFRARHLFQLSAAHEAELITTVQLMLRDAQPQVQDTAANVLIGLLMTMPADSQAAFVASVVDAYKLDTIKKIARLDAAADDAAKAKYEARLRDRRAAVLALAAVVKAHPYDVPDFLPALLERLHRRLGDPLPVSKVATDAFAEFKRTHQDAWATHKLKFTPEQLENLSQLQSSSYFFA